MFNILPAPLRGALVLFLIALNTVACAVPLVLLALIKLVIPVRAVRGLIDPLLNGIATGWIAFNTGLLSISQRTVWDVRGIESLSAAHWYLVNCNHQSWVDILVLQRVFNHRIPLLKFFLKRELLYVPVIGVCWWALDFPFMRRHSATYLQQHPEKRTEDLETARRSCARFALVPTSVMNFPEGTRFSAEKRLRQRSPYRHLLKPRAGALGLSLSVLGERFRSLLDVTIVYPGGTPTFWKFLCHGAPRIVVEVSQLEVPAQLCGGDYQGDAALRGELQQWLADLWGRKDARIAAILGQS
jgi:1-acyl-sn-glycerol-3-phosphate acyltransferase